MIRIYDLHELDYLPKPSWLIEDVLHRGTVAVLAASHAAFKTFLAIDWGMNIALGRDWNGHKTHQGNVIHLVGEGGAGIWVRTKAWRLHNGIELARPAPWACTVTGINLVDENSVTDLAGAALLAFPDGVELLVIDTLARNQQGDENSSQHMSQLVRHVDALRDTLGCTVLILHHFNKGGSFRGSTALEGAFDTVILMDRKNDVSTVRCTKQKDAEEFEPMRLKSKHIDVPNSRDGSLVLELDDDLSPHVATVVKLVGKSGAKGATMEDTKRIILGLSPRPFGESTFKKVWQEAKDKEVIVPKDGIRQLKGTLWVRNLDLIEVAS